MYVEGIPNHLQKGNGVSLWPSCPFYRAEGLFILGTDKMKGKCTRKYHGAEKSPKSYLNQVPNLQESSLA